MSVCLSPGIGSRHAALKVPAGRSHDNSIPDHGKRNLSGVGCICAPMVDSTEISDINLLRPQSNSGRLRKLNINMN